MYYCTCELNLHFPHHRSPVLTGVNFIGITATILILLAWQFNFLFIPTFSFCWTSMRTGVGFSFMGAAIIKKVEYYILYS